MSCDRRRLLTADAAALSFDLAHQMPHPGVATRSDYDAAGNRVRKTRLELGLPVASTITLRGLYERREDTQEGSIEHASGQSTDLWAHVQ